jgi:hypothetical protein
MFVKIERLLQIFSRRIPFFGQFRTKIMKFTTDPSITKPISIHLISFASSWPRHPARPMEVDQRIDAAGLRGSRQKGLIYCLGVER